MMKRFFRNSRSRPNWTILLLTEETVSRIDFQGRLTPEFAAAWHAPRDSGASLPTAAKQAIALSSRNSGRLVVLTSEVWSSAVTLESAIVDAVDRAQLHQTLALELEFESGISPFACRIGATQTSRNEATTTQAAGPGAVRDITWQVVQMEADMYDDLQQQLPRHAAKTMLVAKLDPLVETPDGYGSWQDHAVQLATNWLQTQNSDNPPPVIVACQDVLPNRAATLSAYLLTATVLIGCVTHYAYTSQNLHEDQQTLQSLAAEQKQLVVEKQRLVEQVAQAQKAELALLEKQRMVTKQVELARQRRSEQGARWQRPYVLLRALSDTASDRHLISRVNIEDQAAVVVGFAVDYAALFDLTTSLEAAVDSRGWRVEPATSSRTTSDLVNFELTLSPIGFENVDAGAQAASSASTRGSNTSASPTLQREGRYVR